MTVFNRVIEALQIRYFKIDFREVLKPVHLNGAYEQRDIIWFLNKGNLFVGEEETPLKEGGLYFVPDGQPGFLKQGKAEKYSVFGREGFHTKEERELYVPTVPSTSDVSRMKDSYTIMKFNVKLYDTVSLFSILEIPAFIMPPDENMKELFRKLILEEENTRTGRMRMINTITEQIVIGICRYMESQPKFQKYLDKIDYLLDKRLIKIVQYINENLDKDLSNKTIAGLAYVSEDYVGQFFKSLTNKNLQEYVENQRLDRSLYLLRTRNDSIQEIAHQVGFKDPAYFSRRFKLKFGENANTIRRKENYLT